MCAAATETVGESKRVVEREREKGKPAKFGKAWSEQQRDLQQLCGEMSAFPLTCHAACHYYGGMQLTTPYVLHFNSDTLKTTNLFVQA